MSESEYDITNESETEKMMTPEDRVKMLERQKLLEKAAKNQTFGNPWIDITMIDKYKPCGSTLTMAQVIKAGIPISRSMAKQQKKMGVNFGYKKMK